MQIHFSRSIMLLVISYYRLCTWMHEQRALSDDHELSATAFERGAAKQCQQVVEGIHNAYHLLRSNLSQKEKAILARLINGILFDFVLDEGGSLTWLCAESRSGTSHALQEMVTATNGLLDEMVAITEWDGSVSREVFDAFSKRIDEAKHLCHNMLRGGVAVDL